MSDQLRAVLLQLVDQQRETNILLLQLIQAHCEMIAALSEGEADDEQEAQPATYLNGKPRRASFS